MKAAGTAPGHGPPLTEQQAAVVDSVLAGGVTVVGAGAGSGKTHTMVAAVMALMDAGHTADEFVLITFTNKAAAELRDRVETSIRARATASTSKHRPRWVDQQERLSAAYMGTIHSFALRLLRTYGYDSRVPRTARMTVSTRLLAAALRDTLESVFESGGPNGQALSDLALEEHAIRRLAREIFDAARAQGLSLEDIADQTAAAPHDEGHPYRAAVAELIRETARRYAMDKQAEGVVDTDDLLIKTAELLSDGTTQLPQRLGTRFRFLFVDEFQDTDRTQKQIVDALTPHLEAVLVVGDRKQSVYRFRAAQPSLLDELADENGSSVLPLSMSRRPTQQLLDAQNALFSRMSDRYRELGEPLEPFEGTLARQESLPPVVVAAANASQQPLQLARLIRHVLGRTLETPSVPDEIRPGDFVILTRSNAAMRSLTAELGDLLASDRIEVRADRGSGFFERPEIVATYRMLRLLVRWPDDAALSMALRTPYLAGAVNAGEVERNVLQYGIREGRPITDWLEQAHPDTAATLAHLRRAVRVDTAPQLLGRIYEAFDIRGTLGAAGDTAGLEGLELLREQARSLFDNEQALTLRAFTDWLATAILAGFDVDDGTTAETESRPPFIRVMTIHRAKGLQFPIVIIPGLARRLNNDDLDPEFLLDEDGLDLRLRDCPRMTASPRWAPKMQAESRYRREEEMRLFYVAVTRAQFSVMLVGGGEGVPNSPDDEWYAWRDEVYRARSDLEAHGAIFIGPPRSASIA